MEKMTGDQDFRDLLGLLLFELKLLGKIGQRDSANSNCRSQRRTQWLGEGSQIGRPDIFLASLEFL